MLNTPANNNNEETDMFGEGHMGASHQTPLREDAFEMDDDLKIELIEKHFKEIMHVLGLDLSDDSLKGTPHRVAKMFIKEIFSGLDPKNKPPITLFENRYKYKQMLVEKDISLFSYCEHHFVPIVGRAHVAYIPNGNVVGLSKINRIVQYYAKRPQVQERMTKQIANELREALHTDDVAVVIEAVHYCVASRGVQDTASTTTTAEYCGRFNDPATRLEFMKYLGK
jgi:GTP cyclohydrolase IA